MKAMASSIQQFLNKILSSRYGKDVRQAIHDSIEQCYEDVNNPDLNTKAFETAVQNKIDDGSLALLTIPDGSITKEKLDQDTNDTIEKHTEDIDDLKIGADGNTYKTAGEAVRQQFDKLTDEVERIPQSVCVLDLTSYGSIGTVNNSGIFTETGSKQVKVDIPVSEISEKYSEYFEDKPILKIRPDANGIYQTRVWYKTSEEGEYKNIPSPYTWMSSKEIIPLANVSSMFLQITRIDGNGITDKYDAIRSIQANVERIWENGDLSYNEEFPRKAFEINSYYNSDMARSSFAGIVFPVYSGETLIVDGIKFNVTYIRFDKNLQFIDRINLGGTDKTGSVAYIKDGISIENYTTGEVSRNFTIPDGVRYIAINKVALLEDSNFYINTRPIKMDYDAHCAAALKKYYPWLKKFKGEYDRNNDTCQMISHNASPLVIYAVSVEYRPYRSGEPGDFWIFRDFKPKRFANTIARYGDVVWFDGTALRALRNPYAHEGGETAPNSHYDIVIVGGGAGGVGAAYALCNSGLRVCLIEKENNLGGTHTSGGVFSQIASPIGDWYKAIAQDAYNCAALRFDGNKSYASGEDAETEFDKLWRGSQHNVSSKDTGNLNIYSPFYLYQKYHNDLTDGGIEIRYNREFISCKELNGTVVSATFRNLVSGGEETVTADYFIDSTGDCYLARYGKTLDTDYFIGSDAADKYGETAVKTLPEDPHYDINTLEQIYLYGNYNSAFNINSDGELFTAESPYAEKNSDLPDIEGVTKGQNSAGTIPYYNHSEVIPHSTNTSYYPGVCSYVSPDYYCGITKQEFVQNGYDITWLMAENKTKAHYKLNKKSASTYFIETMPMLAIREGYRMKCEYMVTQKDVETTITSENYAEKHIVALSSWYVDIHQNTSIDTDSVACTYLNGIPYEAMIPCTQKNVLVACRGYGASHIGLAANRLTKTMLSLGYAAGKALMQAKRGWLNDVRDVDVEQLQSDIGIAELLTDIEDNIL